ncbi:MAG: Mg2+ transporter-C family protein [Clostridia bacterium]|nr:MgtC/SapB family protein [Oscillospiraceae bacterium]MBS5433841.1 MgtC/SapB family protein [Bacillota bacterium]PWM14015.1 MAG: Mg2+ transporter-C family protein [Clostridia bacterium]
MENYLDYLRQLNFESMALRIILAMIMGGVIGYERELKHRPAGFRTYMLVALGSAVTVILSQYLDLMLSTGWADSLRENQVGNRTDVVRIGAQVINGIGFIGAGTILVTSRNEVKGLTTAAGLWASACMGLAIGAGFYECFLIGFALVIFIMKLLPLIEDAVLSRARNMNIYIEMDNIENLSNIVNRIKADGIRMYDVDIDREQNSHMPQVNGLFSLRLPEKRHHTEVLAMLSTLDGIISIEEV